MSTSSVENAPRPVPAYVEDADSDSQDEKPEEPIVRPAANVARKVTRRDGASDSGYSSRTHTTGSSSQSSKKQAPVKTSLLGKTMGLMSKKPSSAAKKSAAKEAAKDAAPSQKAVRRQSTSKQKATTEARRPSIHETRSDAARMDITGKPVKLKQPMPIQAYTVRPTTQPSTRHPPPQSFAIPRIQPRPLPYPTLTRERPHSYHMGAVPQMYAYAQSLPTQPTQYISRPYIHPFAIPPMQQPQPIQTAPPAPPPQPVPIPAPAPQIQSGIYVVPSGPSSPNRLINYNFSHTQPPGSYFPPQNAQQQGFWPSQPYQEPQPRRMSASFVPQRTIVEYPRVPAPSQPQTPLSYYSNSNTQFGETMSRTSSYGHPPYAPSRREECFSFDEENDVYGDFLEREAEQREAEIRRARARASMPPPPRPPHQRANTTSMVHRADSQRRVSRRSIDPPVPSPRKHSMEASRPVLSSRTSHSSSSGRNVPVMEAPPSPPLRRRSQVVSFHGDDYLEREIEAYQRYTNGASVNVGLDDVKMLKQKPSKAKTARSGPSDTTSRTSSKSGDKKSKRTSRDGHKDRHDDDALTVRMGKMKLGINGHQGSVNIRQGDDNQFDIRLSGQSKSRAIKDREERSVKYLPTGSGKGEVEVNRSSRTRSRSAVAHEPSHPPVTNGAVRRLKEGSKSRRNSSSRGPAPSTPLEPLYPQDRAL